MILLLTFATAEERDKFEVLYEKYKNLCLHKAHGILHDYALAEDAVSEAYLRVYKNLEKICDPESGRSAAYLVTIVKNVALTMLRKEKTQEAESIDEAYGDGFDLEEHTLAELASEEIISLLDGLGEELKGVFLLKYAYDLPHKEIGRLLGITENNVTVRLHRARGKLAALLGKGGYAGGEAQRRSL